ncbi:CidA/LrgA family protein [Acinetobacter sp. MD2]|uniref:CidA/LrgA family protein n=1 Tax=Acinetobacter sp. MD2 TaxID=2600066 RepID=UPI002D1F403C|nr:CidA/LrgA family protein [Acinetobacter sp. MD2]MEB3766488.1 CidA/LrgA family protein [Acinetobacter sp. MD2]
MNIQPEPQSIALKAFELFKQLLILGCFWAAGEALNQIFHIPISAGILGMFLLLICLFLKVMNIEQVAIGAYAVLGELLLFFLPVVVAVVQYKTLFLTEGWQIVLCIVIGTMSVMLSSCLTIYYYHTIQRYWRLRKRIQHLS